MVRIECGPYRSLRGQIRKQSQLIQRLTISAMWLVQQAGFRGWYPPPLEALPPRLQPLRCRLRQHRQSGPSMAHPPQGSALHP